MSAYNKIIGLIAAAAYTKADLEPGIVPSVHDRKSQFQGRDLQDSDIVISIHCKSWHIRGIVRFKIKNLDQILSNIEFLNAIFFIIGFLFYILPLSHF